MTAKKPATATPVDTKSEPDAPTREQTGENTKVGAEKVTASAEKTVANPRPRTAPKRGGKSGTSKALPGEEVVTPAAEANAGEGTATSRQVQAAAKKGIHIARADENLGDIAILYSVSVEQLAKLNNLRTGFRELTPGQEIKLYPEKP